jgi:hypothetical protein
MHFAEFGPSMRKIGYEGSIRYLWSELDGHVSNTVTFGRLAPKLVKLLSNFHEFLAERFDTCEEAWRAIASLGQQWIGLEDFAEGCARLGLTEDVKIIHASLDSSRQKNRSHQGEGFGVARTAFQIST